MSRVNLLQWIAKLLCLPGGVAAFLKSCVELQAFHNGKGRIIQRRIGEEVSIAFKNPNAMFVRFDWGVEETHPDRRHYRIKACDAHCMQVEDLDYESRLYNIPLQKILVASVSSDPLFRLQVVE